MIVMIHIMEMHKKMHKLKGSLSKLLKLINKVSWTLLAHFIRNHEQGYLLYEIIQYDTSLNESILKSKHDRTRKLVLESSLNA